jgi:LacI family transcriptional regulator
MKSKSSLSNSGTVTLAMVAKMAGVSSSTVSRILNGTAIVSDDKKMAVELAISKLGFVPNPMARGLAGGRTLSIGVVTQAIDSPFYGAALRGVEDELDPAGYSPLFVSAHWNPQLESRCLEMLKARRVDGLILLNARLDDKTLKSTAKELPTVVTGRSIKSNGLFALNFDNFAGGMIATQHLLQLGHRRIAFVSGDPDHPDANERFKGYKTALQQNGIEFNPELVTAGEYHELSGMRAVERLLGKGVHFSALFAANDQMAFGAALSLHRHGLRVPDDVSLVGFDDLANSLYCVPPLTTIHQPAYELGRLAAQAMLQLLSQAVPMVEMPAPRLVLRESSRRISN